MSANASHFAVTLHFPIGGLKCHAQVGRSEPPADALP